MLQGRQREHDRSLTAPLADGARAGDLPRSPRSVGAAVRGSGDVPVVRRAHELDDPVARGPSRVRGPGGGSPLLGRGRERVRRLLPRRHGGDGRTRSEGRRGRDRGTGGTRDHVDAAHRGCGLGGQRDGSSLRPAVLELHAHRHRRQPLRDPVGSPGHAADQGRGPQLVLSRLGGRVLRHARRTGERGRPRGQRRPSGPARGDDARGGDQRPGRARTGARVWRRRRLPVRAGAHEHRHRAAGSGLPRGGPRALHPFGDTAADRRDPHVLRRTGRLHGCVGPGPGHRDDREDPRRRDRHGRLRFQ